MTIFSLRFALAFAFTCAVPCLAATPEESTPRYTITALPPLPGDANSGATVINDRGIVAGWSGSAVGKERVVLRTSATSWKSGRAVALDKRKTVVDSEGYAIDAQGQVLVRSYFHNNRTPADLALRDKSKTYSYLAPNPRMSPSLWNAGTLKVLPLGFAPCMTAGGRILAEPDVDANLGMCIWRNGHTTKLDHIPVDAAIPMVVNDRDQVVCMLMNDGMAIYNHDKQTKVTIPAGFSAAFGFHINASGQVIYCASTGGPRSEANADPPCTAFLWDNGGTQTIRAGATSIAINDRTQVVGWGNDRGSFLWQNGHAYDLAALLPTNSGWTGLQPSAINNRGQIVGDGIFQGRERGFVMTPVVP
jgi:uncharacterized membrane protein